MKKGKKRLRGALALFLAFLCMVTSGVVNPVPVQAESTKDYLNRCEYSRTGLYELTPKLKTIGNAYLVGEDDMAAASWLWNSNTHAAVTHEIYAVEPGTEIQGNIYPSQYYPQDNVAYLKDVIENHNSNVRSSDKIYNMSEGAQYLEREGANLCVVACDENWVTIYDTGYQAWSPADVSEWGAIASFNCSATVDAYLETHPAGFYKIQRSKVWLDLEENLPVNHPYNSEKDIPDMGTGTVTKLVHLRPHPNEDDKTNWKNTPVYALPRGTEVQVISTELTPSEAPGSTNKYYRVSFNGSDKVQNNTTLYMKYKIPGVFYIDSRYLNFAKKGEKVPSGASVGESTGSTVYVYASRDTSSATVGILGKGAQFQIFSAESDPDWTTVWFSGQKAYVQSKYVKKSSYKVTDISNLGIGDIVNDQIVFSWNAGKNNEDFDIVVSRADSIRTTAVEKKILTKKHYKDNTFTLKRKYMRNGAVIRIYVRANTKNGTKGKTYKRAVKLPRGPELKVYARDVGRKKINFKMGIQSLQYSTKKNFKKAKLVQSKKDKYGNYRHFRKVKKLKPGTTYYFRSRGIELYKTAAGSRWLKGTWSKTYKIKTKK